MKEKINPDDRLITVLFEYGEITSLDGATYYHLPRWISREKKDEFFIYGKGDELPGELIDFLNKSRERFFFVSYNVLNPDDGKGVIGHLAFNSKDFPSLLFITEQLIPEKSKVKITEVVITLLYEFKNEADFDEFTLGRNMGEQMDNISMN